VSTAGVIRALRNRPRAELEAASRSLDATLRGRPTPGALRPLLIGQAPGPRTHPDLALFPEPRASAGGRLFEMTGLTTAEYMERFDRVNLLYHFYGKAASRTEDRFPVGHARAAAEAMRHFLRGRQVLLVGKDVAAAFGHGDAPWLRWRLDPAWFYHYAVLPHPSGRNHWYNAASNKRRAVSFLRDWITSGVAFCPAGEETPPATIK
jgi:hypothetical protein